LTEIHATRSTPFSFNVVELETNPGKCWLLQVGVNAPGTAKSTTFFPAHNSSIETGFGPSSVIVDKVIFGNLSPTFIVIFFLPVVN
jgi:hypothetical protein